MKVVIINKSDSRGGAAVVSYRLMNALRKEGVNASMLVAEKLTDDANVHMAGTHSRLRKAFISERLSIFLRNGMNKADLFKIDTGSRGLPLWKHPLVQEADIVCLGWINQGLMSLDGIGKIASVKPVIWTMHDMWCATGICHHAGNCDKYKSMCGYCRLLHAMAGKHDLSYNSFKRKKLLYDSHLSITFVAVSRWLKERCADSGLLAGRHVEVIGNPFPMPGFKYTARQNERERVNMLMVAARLDDSIKGFDILCRALEIIEDKYNSLWRRLHLTLLGDIKDRTVLTGLTVPYETVGSVPSDGVEEYYRKAHILLSPSYYETLPGTLVEAQVYGALPVAFDSGGQKDIVDNGVTGVLATRDTDFETASRSFAEAIVAGVDLIQTTSREESARRMYDSVSEKFSEAKVAREYMRVMKSALSV